MNKYLVIPHIAARHINLLQGNVAVSPHSMTAIALFTHAMGLKNVNIQADAFAVVQHDAWLDAEDMEEFERYAAWQRRSASFIDENDYNSKAEKAPVLSLQPVITGNVEFSLILRYPDGVPSTHNVEDFLRVSRFQGGTIARFGRVKSFDTDMEAMKYIRTGKWIVDHHHELENSNDPLHDMLHICTWKCRNYSEVEETGDYPIIWSTSTVGYALLTKPEIRHDFRLSDNGPVPAAFAEALTGLVGLYSVHDRRVNKIPFWESGFVQEDVYLVRSKFQPAIKKEI